MRRECDNTLIHLSASSPIYSLNYSEASNPAFCGLIANERLPSDGHIAAFRDLFGDSDPCILYVNRTRL